LQRDALLDRMFAYADGAPADLHRAGFWLTCQFAHQTSGMVRIRETLSNCRAKCDYRVRLAIRQRMG
jgi:hypothetical protein